jgi:hypothetical protein
MEIEGATVEQAYKKTWKKYSFEIAAKDKSLFLYADTAEDADGELLLIDDINHPEWIYILSRACSGVKDKLVKKVKAFFPNPF